MELTFNLVDGTASPSQSRTDLALSRLGRSPADAYARRKSPDAEFLRGSLRSYANSRVQNTLLIPALKRKSYGLVPLIGNPGVTVKVSPFSFDRDTPTVVSRRNEKVSFS